MLHYSGLPDFHRKDCELMPFNNLFQITAIIKYVNIFVNELILKIPEYIQQSISSNIPF